MEKHYRFAGIDLTVRLEDSLMYQDERQLGAFRRETAENAHVYEVSVVPALEIPEGKPLASLPGACIYGVDGGYVRCHGAGAGKPENAYMCSEHRRNRHRIFLKEEMVSGRVSARLVLNGLDVEHLVSSSGGVILHASYIGCQGKAILFTAPSETGKSTQAELWKTHRGANIINGDRTALILEEGTVSAAGLPFAGSSGYCENRTLPLGAVVYLKQAPRTSIRPLTGREAFRRVWEGCCVNSWNRSDVESAVSMVERILGQVPVYELACTPDESAVKALEAQLRKQVNL